MCWKAVLSRREFHVVQMVRGGIDVTGGTPLKSNTGEHTDFVSCKCEGWVGRKPGHVFQCGAHVATRGCHLDCLLVDGSRGEALYLSSYPETSSCRKTCTFTISRTFSGAGIWGWPSWMELA